MILDIFKNHRDQYESLIKEFQTLNEMINLSSFNDYENILNKHIFDSLQIFSFSYWQDLYNNKINDITVADIGTGGGFPGLALAIALPHVKFFLIESINKKCRAVETIVKNLKLGNVIIINDRADNIKEKYDTSLSRAVAEFSQVYSWSENITKKPGRIYLYKSPKERIANYTNKISYEIMTDQRVIYEFIV